MAGKEDTQELPTTEPQGMVDVFDKEGVKHRMLRLNAHDMVQHLGWFWRLPGAAEVAQVTQKVVVVVAKAAAELKSEDTEHVDLHSLTQEGLVAFAKKHFDMEFGPAVSREAIIDAILQEQGA